MSVYRILSFDGGGPVELLTTLLLKEIEQRRPGFLKNTDMVAGTSSGAMLALTLASHEDPASCLSAAEGLFENFQKLTANSLIGMGLSLVGLSALFTNERLEIYLRDQCGLGDLTLADLHKRVVITSFRLDSLNMSGLRSWRPKVFHNFGAADDPDYQEKALSVALRSGAGPIAFPTVDGFVDGGVFANNPALVAIAQICDEFRKALAEKRIEQRSLSEIRLLSIGIGHDQEYLDLKDANWGYFKWALNPFNPLVMLNMFLQGGELAVDYQAERILPAGNYYRLDPIYADFSPIPFTANTKNIRATMELPETQKLIDETIAWLDGCDWFEEAETKVTRKKQKAV